MHFVQLHFHLKACTQVPAVALFISKISKCIPSAGGADENFSLEHLHWYQTRCCVLMYSAVGETNTCRFLTVQLFFCMTHYFCFK